MFSFWSDKTPGLEVDLFVSEPFDFDTTYVATDEVQLEGTTTRVVPLPELIEMKRRAGRPRDAEDIEALEALREPEPGS